MKIKILWRSLIATGTHMSIVCEPIRTRLTHISELSIFILVVILKLFVSLMVFFPVRCFAHPLLYPHQCDKS